TPRAAVTDSGSSRSTPTPGRSFRTGSTTTARSRRPAPPAGCRSPSPGLRRSEPRRSVGRTTLVTDESMLGAALRRGDESAFMQLVDEYTPGMRRFARTFVRTSALADDVVQEAWLGVLRGLDRFEGRSSLKTWIYRIVANVARTRAVREAR